MIPAIAPAETPLWWLEVFATAGPLVVVGLEEGVLEVLLSVTFESDMATTCAGEFETVA